MSEKLKPLGDSRSNRSSRKWKLWCVNHEFGHRGAGPYQVSLSTRVFDRIQKLAVVARDRGDGEEFLAALQEFYRRLRVDPQFGDPLTDLQQETGQIRIGIVPPLAMRYGVFEDRRRVFVAALPVLLPKSAAPGST